MKNFEGRVTPVMNRLMVKKHILKPKCSIVIPDAYKKVMETDEGEIVSVGEGVDALFKVGIKVLFGKYAGKELSNTDENNVVSDYTIITDEDIILILEGYTDEQ